MLPRFAVLLLPLCSFAQEPAATPPPEVDRALRERVTQFFQYHVDGEFRKAFELVAEDFKDFYLSGQKNRYKSFTIDSIGYYDNFTRAKVVLNTEVVWQVRTQQAIAKVKTPAAWKLQDGKWMWYDDPKDRKRTPMDPDIETPGEIARAADGTIKLPEITPAAIESAAKAQLKATSIDKTAVTLSEKMPFDRVVLHNAAPGYVNLVVEKMASAAELTLDLDKTQIQPNGYATLKIACNPCTARTEPVAVKLTVEPFGRTFEVLVRIQ